MKKIILSLFLITNFALLAQNDINWDGKYQLQVSDFQSPSSQIGNVKINSIFISCGPEFAFYMSNFEFMFTKNFNSKVSCQFKRNSSSLVATNATIALELVNFAQYQFDLSELYARKLRKKIYEEKSTFSDINFIKTFSDAILEEYTTKSTNIMKETDLGRKKENLKILQSEVLLQIEELSDFCKECKPPKKK